AGELQVGVRAFGAVEDDGSWKEGCFLHEVSAELDLHDVGEGRRLAGQWEEVALLGQLLAQVAGGRRGERPVMGGVFPEHAHDRWPPVRRLLAKPLEKRRGHWVTACPTGMTPPRNPCAREADSVASAIPRRSPRRRLVRRGAV